MISKKEKYYLKKGILEELQSTDSFIIQDKSRFQTVILYWFFTEKYKDSPLGDYILSDLSRQWESYFKMLAEEQS